MIAGTCTPLAAHRLSYPWNNVTLLTVWVGAVLGLALKCIFPRRFEYAGLILCVALGLSTLVSIGLMHSATAATNLDLLVAGACVYLIGVAALLLERVRFHTAVWHTLVLIAASLHFAAITRELVTS